MDDNEFNFLKREVLNLTGVDLTFYKRPQMERRLKTYLLRSGHSTWSAYFRDTRTNVDEQAKLKDYLTINVSSFFRDPEKYTYLQTKILPELLHPPKNFPGTNSPATTTGRQLKIWSAGCSRGQEPFTLAMMLAGITGPYTKHYILATDLDKSALAWAQAGGPYTTDEVANVPPDLLNRYFKQQGKGYYVNQFIRDKITFRQHNLLADPFENNFDLIICRNVVIYFTAEVKDKLYQKFYQALKPGGILFVGGTEIISKASAIGLHTAGISFYRRGEAGAVRAMGGPRL